MVKFGYRTGFRRVPLTISLPEGNATFFHPGVASRTTIGELTLWVTRARHEASEFIYALRDDVSGRLLAADETLDDLRRQHNGHVHLSLHIDPQMA